MKNEKQTPLLSLQELCKYYTGTNVVVGLNHLNVSFQVGEFVAITGESGSGKSTLAHVVSGMLPYEGGEMLLTVPPGIRQLHFPELRNFAGQHGPWQCSQRPADRRFGKS